MACDCAFLQRDLTIMHGGEGKSMPVLRCYLGVESPRHCKQDLRLLESPESWFLNITQDLSTLLFLFASYHSLGGFFMKRLGLRSSIPPWRALSWNINKQKLFFSTVFFANCKLNQQHNILDRTKGYLVCLEIIQITTRSLHVI